MVRERYLLRADREAYTYREILEVKPGSVRLLHPSKNARRLSRWTSTLFALGYIFVLGYFINAGIGAGFMITGMIGPIIVAGFFAFYIAGLFLLVLWWDNRSLVILAENPDSAVPVDVLGVTSFGTFQEVRARADKQELRIAVHGPAQQVAEALRFAGLSISAS